MTAPTTLLLTNSTQINSGPICEVKYTVIQVLQIEQENNKVIKLKVRGEKLRWESLGRKSRKERRKGHSGYSKLSTTFGSA